MSDVPGNPNPASTEPPPPPRGASPLAPPPPPAPPPGAAWYYGPFPPPGTPSDGFGRSLSKTAARGCVASVAFGLGILVVVGLIAGIIAAVVSSAGDGGGDALTTLKPNTFVYGDEKSDDKLLLLKVDGVILGEKPDSIGLFGDGGAVYGYEIKEKLRLAALDGTIKGVIVEFATPGGTVFGARAIADGISQYQKASGGKPVVAFVEGISASGGMYGMAPATKILADHGSLIGSIGVRLGTFVYYDGVTATEGGLLGGGVTTRNGITYTTFSAGRSKDIGSPYRPVTDEERRVLQQGLDNEYANFVTAVATARKIPEATIRDQMGALIFDNKTAKDYGLIDGTATREEAYIELARLAAVSTFKVVREKESSGLLGGVFGQANGVGGQSAAATPEGICFPQNLVLAYYGEPTELCRKK